jgi:aminopeptidase
MEKAKEVHISGEETDLHFSIEGIGTKPCCGEHNIPDGECFTAPVRESIEGTVAFNAPAIREGFGYEQIRLRFEKGRAVEAFAANPQQTEKLNKVLDQDEGARYVGEFALGFNPGILEPMRDTLFDEKIAGSFHMALGQCYEQEAPNGNSSTIHWDLVCIQRPEKGGGEIYFDGELIRKDGLFIPSDLQGLNPQALLP